MVAYINFFFERQDFFTFKINVPSEVIEKIVYNGKKPKLVAYYMSVFGGKLLMDGEKISDEPYALYKMKNDLLVGSPFAEIISSVDMNDKDRKEWNLKYSFIFHLALLKGDLKSGNFQIAQIGEGIFLETKDIQ